MKINNKKYEIGDLVQWEYLNLLHNFGYIIDINQESKEIFIKFLDDVQPLWFDFDDSEVSKI